MNIFSMTRSQMNARYCDILHLMIEESRGGAKVTSEMELELDMYRTALERLDAIDALAKLTREVANYSDQLTIIHSG